MPDSIEYERLETFPQDNEDKENLFKDLDYDWFTGVQPVVEPVVKPDRKIALQAHNGQYVCAENGGGSCLVANRSNIDHWETFKLSIAVLSWVQYSSSRA